MTARQKQFKNPPLVEVFCEFFFAPPDGGEWDSFLVSTFYNKIKKDFPVRKRISTVGISLRVQGGGTPPELQPAIGPPTPRHRFIAKDGKTLVQLGDNLLVVNQLPPYYGWERFHPIVATCFQHYLKLWKPQSVARAAVHYIDKVDLPGPEINLEDYFGLLPGLPDFPGTAPTNIAMAYEVKGASDGDIVAVTMKQHPSANPSGVSFMFQWDYVSTQGMQAETAAVTKWLGDAHDFLSQMFDGAFTTRCKELFNR